jgi:2-isopropylmalate synthase
MAGARQVECTINGIGERAGNASLEEIVMALEVRADALPHRTGIQTQALVPTSNTLSSIVGVSVPPNKAIVGANAFAHEAGIHQDGMLKHELTYEIMRPESVGAPGTRLGAGQALGHARSRRALPRPRPSAATAGARTPLREGDGACRSHQVGR